jgi:hypothetical protein
MGDGAASGGPVIKIPVGGMKEVERRIRAEKVRPPLGDIAWGIGGLGIISVGILMDWPLVCMGGSIAEVVAWRAASKHIQEEQIRGVFRKLREKDDEQWGGGVECG